MIGAGPIRCRDMYRHGRLPGWVPRCDPRFRQGV